MIVRFGLFSLDLGTAELSRSDKSINLQPQPARILCHLVQHADRTVTREELTQAIWDGTHVESDSSLNYCIRQIRIALDDVAESPRFIETRRGRGYRFIAPTDCGSLDDRVTPPAKRRRGTLAWAVGLTAIIGVIASSVAMRPSTESVDPIVQRTLAILPFTNIDRPAEPDALSEGFTEELTAALTHVPAERLTVIAPTSSNRYRDSALGISEIGENLNADLIVTGTVQHRQDLLRITAKLVQAEDGRVLWAERYERPISQLFDVQQDVANQVAARLALELPTPLTPAPEVHRALLMSRFHLAKRTAEGLAKSIELLEQAIEVDPNYGPALVELANAVNSCPSESYGGPDRVRELAEAGLRLDPTSANGHYLVGTVDFFHDWNWDRAREAFERSVTRNPNLALGYKGLAFYYSSQSKFDHAIANVEHALALDPVSVNLNADLGWFFYRARRFDDAVIQSRTTLELEPGDAAAETCLAFSLMRLGRGVEAWPYVRKVMERGNADAESVMRLERLAETEPSRVIKGYRKWVLDTLESQATAGRPYAWGLASAYTDDGQYDLALDWLERSIAERTGSAPFLAIDPALIPLHNLPRFRALLKQLNLPAPMPST